jgi:hypothetical protein
MGAPRRRVVEMTQHRYVHQTGYWNRYLTRKAATAIQQHGVVALDKRFERKECL